MSTAVAVKERPILFSGAMVRAILAGKKTQTRRVINPQPTVHDFGRGVEPALVGRSLCSGYLAVGVDRFNQGEHGPVRCPYGHLGDRLWVRETFQIENTAEYGVWNADPPEGPTLTVHAGEPEEHVLIPRYRATAPDTLLEVVEHDGDDPREGMRWRPSIFMPRWASRITLEVTAVRVERLQEITAGDAYAEGMRGHPTTCDKGAYLYSDGRLPAFRSGWDAINEARGFGWDVNPWVWVVSFKRVA